MPNNSKYPDSIKVGKPILAPAPHGWEQQSLNHYIEPILRKKIIEDNERYCLVTVKRSRGGVVPRSQLLGKQISVKSQFTIRAGDFLISKRQIVHGACGLVLKELDGSIVSNEYCIFKTKPNFLNLYLQYLSETLYFQQTCFHSSIGVHIEKMIFKLQDWFKWKFNIPPLIEQKRIVEILSTWDKAINTTEKLLANSEQQKKALMQQLLTGKKRFPWFKEPWKKVELGKLLDYQQPTPYLVKSSDYSNGYQVPVLTAGKTFILGYTNEDFGIFNENLPVIIFDDFTTASKFVSVPFKAKSSAMKILVAKEGVSIKYVFEAMQILNYPIGGHQRHWISIFSNLVIGLPSSEEQQKIAKILSAADREIETLKQELDSLKMEKIALMQQLLTGKRRVLI